MSDFEPHGPRREPDPRWPPEDEPGPVPPRPLSSREAAAYRDERDRSRDDYNPGRDDYNPGRDDYNPGRDDYNPGRDDYNPGRDDFGRDLDRGDRPGSRPPLDRRDDWADGRRPNSDPPRAAWVLGLAALVVCGGLGLFYLFGPRTESSDLETTGGTGQLAVLATTSTTGDGEAAQTTEAPGSTAATSPPGTLTGRVAGEEILVEGEVPSTQSAAALKLLLEQVMGVGNVNTDGVAINAAASSPDRIDVIVDSELVFPSGSAEIQPEFLVTLDRMATLMMTNTGVTTVVEGHADSRGDKAVNLSLSQRRADSVVAYLESKGIESTRLTPVGKGSTEPIADDSTEEGRRQNRRIEFSVQGFRLEL